MTDNKNSDTSAITARNEDQVTTLFEIAVASMHLNGLNPDFEVLIVFNNPKNGGTAIAGTVDWHKARDIIQQYIDKGLAADAACAEALKNMRGKKHG